MKAGANSENFRTEYERRGYVVYRGLIDPALIDALVSEYEVALKLTRKPILRQSVPGWSRNDLNDFGHVTQSMIQVHCLDQLGFDAFASRVRDILSHSTVRAALTELTGESSLTLAQSMFFDANTNTPPHQDCYYLDSVPGGRLLGAWFALEDIATEAGRFYVVPGSHRHEFAYSEEELGDPEKYAARMREFLETRPAQDPSNAVSSPVLRKGDVLFWHSRTVHGASATINHRFSRKSLTAHYLPTGSSFGNIRGEIIQRDCGSHNGMPFYHWKIKAWPLPGGGRLMSVAIRLRALVKNVFRKPRN